jgi:hypothetical protein
MPRMRALYVTQAMRAKTPSMIAESEDAEHDSEGVEVLFGLS